MLLSSLLHLYNPSLQLEIIIPATVMEEMAWENAHYVTQGYVHERDLWSTHNTPTAILRSADGLTVLLMCPAEHKAGVFLCRGSSLMDSERTRDHPSQSLISCYSHWLKAPWRVDTGSIQHGCSSLSSWPIFLWQTLVAQSFFSMGPPRRGWCSVYKGCFEVKAALLSFWILFIKAKCPFCLSAGLH